MTEAVGVWQILSRTRFWLGYCCWWSCWKWQRIYLILILLFYFSVSFGFKVTSTWEYLRRNLPLFCVKTTSLFIAVFILISFFLPISKYHNFYVQRNLWECVPIIQYFNWIFYTNSESWVGSQKISNKIFYFIRHLVFGLIGVFGKSVDSSRNSHSIRINKGMREVSQSIEDTAYHPDIHLVPNFILKIGIDNFRRSVHGSGDGFDLFLNVVVLCFVDAFEIYESVWTWTEIA